METYDPSIRSFVDTLGRVTSWPAKFGKQQLLTQYLVTKFEYDRYYSEKEVNAMLNEWHTFGDWALLRRALVDDKLMQRKSDGTNYRRLRLG